MIYYRLDPDTNHLSEISTCPFVDEEPYQTMDDEKFQAERGYDGYKFLKDFMETDEYKKAAKEYRYKAEIEYLRVRRERECFPYINRGELWYKNITEAQKTELDEWYKKWLMVTETMKVPERPEWLH